MSLSNNHHHNSSSNNLTTLPSVSQSSPSPKQAISQCLRCTAAKQNKSVSKSIKQELRGDDLVNTTQTESVCTHSANKSDAQNGAQKKLRKTISGQQHQSQKNQMKLDKDTLVRYQLDQISQLFLSKVNSIKCLMAGKSSNQQASSKVSLAKSNQLTREETNVLKILKMFKRIYRIEDDIFIIGLVFLDKIQELLKSKSCARTTTSVKDNLLYDTFKLLVMTLALSSKCYYDKFECGTQFSLFAKVNKSQFRRLMLQYLELIDYRLFVSSENFTSQLKQINTAVVQRITSQGINAVQIVRPEMETEADTQSHRQGQVIQVPSHQKQQVEIEKEQNSKKIINQYQQSPIVAENPCDVTMASSDQQQYKFARKENQNNISNDDHTIIIEEQNNQTSLMRI